MDQTPALGQHLLCGPSPRAPRLRMALALTLILSLLGMGGRATLAAPPSIFFNVSLNTADFPIIEGNTGTKTIHYVVQLSQSLSAGQSVTIQMTTLSTATNPATLGVDYNATTTNLVFSPGQSQKTFPVTIIGDTIDELNEGFIVRATVTALTNVTGMAVSDVINTTAIINDDDNPTVASISSPTAYENDGTIKFVVTLSSASAVEDIGIAYKTVTTGSAIDSTVDAAHGDFTGTQSGLLLISQGVITGTISIPLIDSPAVIEPDETFQIQLIPDLSFSVNAPFTQTVATGTIKDHNNPPTAANDSATVTEDAGATGIDVLTNDPNSDGGPKAIASVTQPTHGSVIITGGGTGLTYQPSANYCNNGSPLDTFTYTLTPGGSIGTVSITVTCVNDGPIVDANGAGAGINSTAAYTEKAAAATIAPSLTISDQEGDAISSVVVTISNLANGSAESLDVTGALPSGFSAVYNSTAGTLTISGSTTDVGTMATLLRTLTYANTSNNPGTSRTISVAATDNGAPTAATSNPAAQIVITITTINDPPTLPAPLPGLTLNEGSSANITSSELQASDPDTVAASLVFTVTVAPVNGQLLKGGTALAAGDTFTQADINNGLLSYAHSGSETTSDSFTFTLGDGTTALSAKVFPITIVPVNDTPVIALTAGATLYQLGSPPARIDTGATVTDADSANFNGGYLQIVIPGGGVGDTLGVRNEGSAAGQISVSGTTIAYGGTTIGTVTISTGTVLKITLNASATPTATQALARNITFSNTAPSTTPGARVAIFTVNDGASTSLRGSKTITLNQPPIAAGDTAGVTMNGPAQPIDVMKNDSDPDSDPLTITAVTQGAHGTVVISVGGAGVTYQPAADYLGPDSFTYTISDGRGGDATATVLVAVRKATAYLPIVLKPAFADLTVRFKVTPATPTAGQPTSIEVTVTNSGDGPASNFWVDFYIDPTATPQVNDRWNDLCRPEGFPCYGMAWYYTGTLAPGQSIVLNSNEQSPTNPNGFVVDSSVWPGYFYNGVTKLYAIADSWNRDPSGAIRAPTGAVIEKDETNNSAAQNISVLFGLLPGQAR